MGSSGKPIDYARRPNLAGLPVYIYGNSYGILAAGWMTTGNHYSQQAIKDLFGGTVTSYALSGKRILDVLSSLINESAIAGIATAPIAGSKWPGTSTRNGLVIFECAFNDIGHYPTMVGTAIPAALPTANTRYRDSLKGQYRAALALMSSESRIENGSFTVSGTWTRGTAAGYASNGSLDFTTAVGAYAEVSVTPPQRGPLAGKVFLLTYGLDPAAGTTAVTNITVDGVAGGTYTPPAWELYVGPAGGNVNTSWNVIPVTVPVDGNAHTVRFTHAGTAGHILYNDCLIVPSEDPNPIAVMGCERGPVAGPVWTAAQVGTFRANMATLIPDIKSVVAEFPNAIYVPSTMTANGIYSLDGIHPNDRGHSQRAVDLVAALQPVQPLLRNKALAAASSGFGVL